MLQGLVEAPDHTAKRGLIKTWGAETLVRVHNYLVRRIMANGTIDHEREGMLLLAMGQEGIESKGEYHGCIEIERELGPVDHAFGISQFDPQTGQTLTTAGYRRLQVWRIINPQS